jgi:hypothetical protein
MASEKEITFGDFAGGGDQVEFLPARYLAVVTNVENVGPSKFNPEKDQFQFEFDLEDDKGAVVAHTSMWVNATLGFSKIFGHSKLSQLIQALTGIPCGEKGQRQLRIKELVGLKLWVQAEPNEKGYARIKEYEPYEAFELLSPSLV